VDRSAAGSQRIAGHNRGSTALDSPRGIAVDPAGDRLFVTSTPGGSRSILVFDNARTAFGNIAPSRTIVIAPAPFGFDIYAFFLDIPHDRLCLANNVASSVIVINNASTASGTATPAVVTNLLSGVFGPFGIFVDTR
jgi:DNA-binding beta-propeller fold protein YncE